MVKIDVITGFLGSGKTTFIKKVLQQDIFKNEKIVLIENEFGEIAIDGSFFEDNTLKLYEISKGCICCSLKGEFLETLEQIIEELNPDRILIEPSGIFVIEDLFEILKNKRIDGKCYLNGIHTLVDIKYFRESKMRYAKFFHSQIHAATNLILSKLDDYKEDEVERTIEELKHDNHRANIISIPIESITKEELKIIFKDNTTYKYNNITPDIKEEKHGKLYHIESMGIEPVPRMNKTQFEQFIDLIQSDQAGYVIRLKGYLVIDDKMYSINYVYSDYELLEVDKETAPRISIIGDHLNKQKIVNQINSKV